MATSRKRQNNLRYTSEVSECYAIVGESIEKSIVDDETTMNTSKVERLLKKRWYLLKKQDSVDEKRLKS